MLLSRARKESHNKEKFGIYLVGVRVCLSCVKAAEYEQSVGEQAAAYLYYYLKLCLLFSRDEGSNPPSFQEDSLLNIFHM